ncbi:tripartite motif-containing protein 2-like [Oncorhynchus masou masou]|uniref:tripartite motif-containing protein 2-like n=1 Tax=Oncorhynchus masou masou TaxID=90313 RepID=UPI0031833C3B
MELEVTYGLKQKVLQAQLDTLLHGQGGIVDTCTQTEETLSVEARATSLQAERGLGERLRDLASQGLPFQAEENDQLDLLMETEGLRKSIHKLGTIITTSKSS